MTGSCKYTPQFGFVYMNASRPKVYVVEAKDRKKALEIFVATMKKRQHSDDIKDYREDIFNGDLVVMNIENIRTPFALREA